MINWKEIDEKQTRKMLQEVFDDLTNDGLMSLYFDALEKRYKKPTGTISNYIFYDDLSIDEIIKKLKIDTVIYL